MEAHYFSDSGNRDCGIEMRIPLTNQEENYPPIAVINLAKKIGARLITRTKYFTPDKPGAWYIKGNSQTNYSQVITRIENNVATGKFRRRECWILSPYSLPSI